MMTKPSIDAMLFEYSSSELAVRIAACQHDYPMQLGFVDFPFDEWKTTLKGRWYLHCFNECNVMWQKVKAFEVEAGLPEFTMLSLVNWYKLP